MPKSIVIIPILSDLHLTESANVIQDLRSIFNVRRVKPGTSFYIYERLSHKPTIFIGTILGRYGTITGKSLCDIGGNPIPVEKLMGGLNTFRNNEDDEVVIIYSDTTDKKDVSDAYYLCRPQFKKNKIMFYNASTVLKEYKAEK